MTTRFALRKGHHDKRLAVKISPRVSSEGKYEAPYDFRSAAGTSRLV